MKIGYLMEKGEEIRTAPFNGPANHVRHVVQALQRMGHTVQILFRLADQLWVAEDLQSFRSITVRRSDQGVFRMVERVVRRTQTVFGLPFLGLFDSLRFASACTQELWSCDIYLERMSWMTYGGLIAARRQKIPLVLEYNGDPIADLKAKGELPTGLQLYLARALTGWTLRSAHRLIATGAGWKKNLIQQWGVEDRKIAIVENGTSILQILDRSQLRSFQEIDAPDRPLTFVYLGGFYAWHGIHILIQAFSRVIHQYSNLHLELIGSGDGEASARELTQRLGLTNVIHFRGRMTEMDYASHLADADIAFSPYCGWPEYSGLKLFDYKAAGLPTIASGENGQPSTLQHGKTGWIVPPCDEEALVAAIQTLCTDAALRRKIGRQARLEAEQIHSWEHTAHKIEQILYEAQTTG